MVNVLCSPTVVAFIVFCGVQTPVARAQDQAIAPDAELQAQIRRTVSAILARERNDGFTQVLTEIEALERVANRRKETLVAQLLYFMASAKDVSESMPPWLIMHHLRIPKSIIARATFPFVNAAAPELERSARKLLQHVEDGSGEGVPDYSHYRSLIQADTENPPAVLIEYMFQKSPGTAVLSMLRVFDDNPTRTKAVLWAEHVVSDVLWKQQHGFLRPDEIEAPAAGQLDKLSKYDEWWIRLYVAAIINQHPEFKTPELNARLEGDKHPAVRKAVSRKPADR